MGSPSTSKEINEELCRLLAGLDEAISQTIENPLLFADSPLLHKLGTSCSRLMDSAGRGGNGAGAKANGTPGLTPMTGEETLLWQVRARAGRLQLLLDAAAQFYSHCFALAESEGLAYGVHGEWSALAGPNRLVIDC